MKVMVKGDKGSRGGGSKAEGVVGCRGWGVQVQGCRVYGCRGLGCRGRVHAQPPRVHQGMCSVRFHATQRAPECTQPLLQAALVAVPCRGGNPLPAHSRPTSNQKEKTAQAKKRRGAQLCAPQQHGWKGARKLARMLPAPPQTRPSAPAGSWPPPCSPGAPAAWPTHPRHAARG